MNRRVALAGMASTVMVAACGRQVTGLNAQQSGSLPAGKILFRFATQGPQDFNNLLYAIIFNTSGNGLEPLATNYPNNLTNYSYALLFGGNSGGVSSQFFQYFPTPGTQAGFQARSIPIDPSLLTFTPNSNGLGSQFQALVDRRLFNVPLPTATATPTPSATPTASPTPSPGPTGSAAPSPTPSPSPSPNVANLWAINYFTLDLSQRPLDALGTLGVQDVSFSLQVDVSTSFDKVYNRPAGSSGPATPAAFITQAEIINAP